MHRQTAPKTLPVALTRYDGDTLIAVVESHSNPGTFHTLTLDTKTGAGTCDCPSRGECYHLRCLREQAKQEITGQIDTRYWHGLLGGYTLIELYLPGQTLSRTIDGGYWRALDELQALAGEYDVLVQRVTHESRLGTQIKEVA